MAILASPVPEGDTAVKWTPERSAQARLICLEEIKERGQYGYLRRAAKRLDMSFDSLEAYVNRRAPWRAEIKTAGRTPESGTPPAEPDDPRIRKVERENIRLSDELRELRCKVKADDRTHGVIEALSRQVVETYEPISYVKIPERQPKKGQEEVDGVAILSDQHGDRIVREEGTWGLERYDFNVYRARFHEYIKVIRAYVTRHLPNYHFHTLWFWHLGDSVNGDIHNMKLKNHWANSLKAALAVGDVQAQGLLSLADCVKRIVVVCVSGNHGRTTKQVEYEDPHDNFDYLTAKAMQLRLAEYSDRIQVFTPRSWSAHVEVRGHLCHLNHGHGVTGTWGIPWYGFERREGRVQRLLSFKNHSVSYYFYGHFHTPITRPAGQAKAIHAGPWYFSDEFSLNRMSVGNPPEQQFLMFSERFGRQLEIPIMLRDLEAEERLHAGEWDPPFGRSLVIDEPEQAFNEMPVIA
jgi:hypothetical protein